MLALNRRASTTVRLGAEINTRQISTYAASKVADLATRSQTQWVSGSGGGHRNNAGVQLRLHPGPAAGGGWPWMNMTTPAVHHSKPPSSHQVRIEITCGFFVSSPPSLLRLKPSAPPLGKK